MQTDTVHQFIHNECRTSHIARVLHQRDEQIEYQNIRKKDNDTTHAADDSVDDQVFQRAITHQAADRRREPINTRFDPLLRVCAQREGCRKHHPHQQEKDRETKDAVGYNRIDYRGCFDRILLALLVCFAQSSRNETILLARYGHLDILAKLLIDALDLAITHRNPLAITLDRLQGLLGLLVAFEQFDRPIARREVLGQLITHGAHHILQRRNTALDHRTVVDVNMSHAAIAVFIDVNNRIEQALQTTTIACHDGHHRHTKHCAQLLIIELVATLLQLVVHIERNHHIGVDIDQLGCKV